MKDAGWIAELRVGTGGQSSPSRRRSKIGRSGRPRDAGERRGGRPGKPFLVVGFNFTPDYSDPIVKRALVAVGLNAGAAIYGGREPSEEMPERALADIRLVPCLRARRPSSSRSRMDPSEAADGDGEGEAVREEATNVHASGRLLGLAQGPGSTRRASRRRTSLSEGPEHEESPAGRTAGGMRIPEAAISAAGQVTATTGGRTIAEVVQLAAGGDGKAVAWLSWAKSNLGPEDEKRQALELYANAREPSYGRTSRESPSVRRVPLADRRRAGAVPVRNAMTRSARRPGDRRPRGAARRTDVRLPQIA